MVVKMTMSQEAKAETGWKPGVRSEAKEILEAVQWPPIVAYCDADWASSTRDCKSTSGYVLTWCGMVIDAGSDTQPRLPA